MRTYRYSWGVWRGLRVVHYPANAAHIRQSRLDAGLDFEVKVLTPVYGVPSLLGSGRRRKKLAGSS